MPKINLSIPSSFDGDILAALEQAIEQALPKISAFAMDRILQVADQKLTTAAQAYRAGFGPEAVQATKTGFEIVPTTELAQALEEGFDAFDIKAVMLSSSSVKFGAGGEPYVDVPFRHGRAGSKRLRPMSADIDRLVRNATRRESRAAKREERPQAERLRVTGVHPAQRPRERKLRMGGSSVPTRAEHKTSIFTGMIRSKAGGSTQYQTIRRISANSSAQSWWHPGYEGVNAIEQVSKTLHDTALKVTKAELRAVGFKVQ